MSRTYVLGWHWHGAKWNCLQIIYFVRFTVICFGSCWIYRSHQISVYRWVWSWVDVAWNSLKQPSAWVRVFRFKPGILGHRLHFWFHLIIWPSCEGTLSIRLEYARIVLARHLQSLAPHPQTVEIAAWIVFKPKFQPRWARGFEDALLRNSQMMEKAAVKKQAMSAHLQPLSNSVWFLLILLCCWSLSSWWECCGPPGPVWKICSGFCWSCSLLVSIWQPNRPQGINNASELWPHRTLLSVLGILVDILLPRPRCPGGWPHHKLMLNSTGASFFPDDLCRMPSNVLPCWVAKYHDIGSRFITRFTSMHGLRLSTTCNFIQWIMIFFKLCSCNFRSILWKSHSPSFPMRERRSIFMCCTEVAAFSPDPAGAPSPAIWCAWCVCETVKQRTEIF